MNVSIIIATHGDEAWAQAAWEVAYPSTLDQGACEVLVWHLKVGTVAQARNEAADEAWGDWLCFLDADDELEPVYLEAMRGAEMRRTPRTLLTPAVRYVDGRGQESAAEIPNRGRWPDLNECVIGTLVSHALFDEVGGFRELPSLEDYDLWLRCHKLGASIVYVPDAVYRVGVRADGRNSDQSIYYQLRAEHAEVWGRRQP